ncbi:MAG: APC family permease [Myxococcota bacterium]|nr:APC family permease [Myxococcota bacterium]
MSLIDFVLGRPLTTSEECDERVGPLRGVGILGLDALASAAYGPEALLTLMIPLGAAAIRYEIPLTALIVALLVIVYFSYRQTIEAYPNGGGSYTVAKENLGRNASLAAAAALSLDYVLNVAVAISAGVGALVSAVPALLTYTLPLCLGILLLLTLINLRGVRSSGALFLLPTYCFLGTLFVVIAVGTFQSVTHGGHPVPAVAPPRMAQATEVASLWLLVRAFANGCTAMTGVEAVSNGVPIFREPAAKGARRTLALIIGSLVTLLVGISLLSRSYGIGATPPGKSGYQSILSQLVGATLGRGPLYSVTMGSIFAVLALSANTSFADFPRLCRILAIDGFLPESFAHRGRRLAYSRGITVLCILSGLLLLVFGGVTDALIPLFALGAFLAFTLSQAGMVEHWRKRGRRRGKLFMNAVGALCTGLTCCVVVASKFTDGAWISVGLATAMWALFWAVRRHHDFVARVIRTDSSLELGPMQSPIAVVPMRRWDAVSLKALRFAFGLAPEVVAVQVLTDEHEADDLSGRWETLVAEPARRLGVKPPELVVLRSEYRRLYDPLIEHVRGVAEANPTRQIAVIVPELIEPGWYRFLLHSHTAALLRSLLVLRGGPQILVVDVPWYLRDWMPEHERLGERPSRFASAFGRAHPRDGERAR